jgi:hypothetical protein
VRRPAAVPAAGRSSADRRHCDRASRTALQPHEWAGAEARAGGRSSIGCMPNRTLSTVSTPRSAVIHCTLGARAVPVLQWAVSASCGHTGESAPRKAPAPYSAAPSRRSDAVALAWKLAMCLRQPRQRRTTARTAREACAGRLLEAHPRGVPAGLAH